ncbi:uncharacterized protein MELLADRAFT_96078 [Melampsora larici-populina 98AG31]|uniref:Uncharacterized protein n=1 Tax=Melampsora larici-populina (strain 98AG31 / pathotype 3-4-7) TaxID=747676 RepID=F4SAV8_MELLP|nr:uncharacterized protein MELLADRAFT_96078 [Melampsora larici-populina 98AG31]EGF98236.1 hypothetical protein MELLADRAFT_96078 [Melampsora larici-populina 98AG31]
MDGYLQPPPPSYPSQRLPSMFTREPVPPNHHDEALISYNHMGTEHLNRPMTGIYGSQPFPSVEVSPESFNPTPYDHFRSASQSPHYSPHYGQPHSHNAPLLMSPPPQPQLRGRVIEQQCGIIAAPLASTAPVNPQRTQISKPANTPRDTPLDSSDSKCEEVHRIWSKQKNDLGHSAFDILVQWVLEPGNYNRWRVKGSKKSDICEEIHQILIKNGIFGRNASGVYQQIHFLEKRFRAARDETKKTGGGFNGFPGERQFSEKIEAICPHFYDLQPVMGDRPSAMPLDQIESLSDLDTDTCMKALRLTSSQASTSQGHEDIIDLEDDNFTSEVIDTDESFELPPPINHPALMQAINQADHPSKTKRGKHFRDSSVGSQDDISNSPAHPSSSKKARGLAGGTFLKAIGFDDKPDTSLNNRKAASVSEELKRFQDNNSKQRDRALDLHREAIQGQVSIGESIGGAMNEMTGVLKLIVNPPKDKITQELDDLRLLRERSDYEYRLAKQRSEMMDLELKRKAKLIERFEKAGKSFSEANQRADQMIEEQKKRMAEEAQKN